jgi:hypothetical protein
MPIKAGNVKVGTNKELEHEQPPEPINRSSIRAGSIVRRAPKEVAPPPAEQPPVPQPTIRPGPPPKPKRVRSVAADPREAVLVVNGKQMKIGKKSKYLLDMLSLDE